MRSGRESRAPLSLSVFECHVTRTVFFIISRSSDIQNSTEPTGLTVPLKGMGRGGGVREERVEEVGVMVEASHAHATQWQWCWRRRRVAP